MLSAFTARPIIELKQRDKSKIETILAYGVFLSTFVLLNIILPVSHRTNTTGIKVIEFSLASIPALSGFTD